MTYLSFDTLGFSNIADAFFNNTRMIYIAANMPAYKLGGLINKALDFNFVRRCDLDIMVEASVVEHLDKGLFDAFANDEFAAQYFPIYHYAVPHSAIDFFMIGNQSGTKYLIPEMKHASFFLMIRQHMNLTFDKELTAMLSQIEGVDIVRDIPVNDFRYKDALIFE